MSKKKVSVVQLNGCDRCAWHTLQLQDWEDYQLVNHPLIKNGTDIDDVGKVDLLIVTGYANSEDQSKIETLATKAKTIVAFGTCPYSGGIFGLKNQKGGTVIPLNKIIKVDASIIGCPPNPEEILSVIESSGKGSIEGLCGSCTKTFDQGFFTEISRPGNLENNGKCFNNVGIPCSGVVSGNCTQRCIDFETPCRGCVDKAEDPSASMIGFYGSLARDIDVATQANWWTTDKLSDESDEITESLVDVVGTFFRFHLASAYPRGGIVSTTGNDYSDVMVGRPVEEAIQIAATIYGSKGISVALNLVEAYEKAIGQEPSAQVQELRQSLRDAQKAWVDASESPGNGAFREVSKTLRGIAGNEVLSNVFFGGFKTAVADTKHAFDSYKVNGFEPSEVSASHEDEFTKVSYMTDAKGIIREWLCEF